MAQQPVGQDGLGDTSGQTAIGACPACGAKLTRKQLAFGTEDYAFRCSACDARLAKSTSAFPILIVGGLAVIGVIYAFTDRSWLFPALGIWTGVLVFVGARSTRVRLAEDSLQDEPVEKIPDEPPPPEQGFRGSSGPPPSQKK